VENIVTGPNSLAKATVSITTNFKLAKTGVEGFVMGGPITADIAYTGLNSGCNTGSSALEVT
jgi:hypothetical protein